MSNGSLAFQEFQLPEVGAAAGSPRFGPPSLSNHVEIYEKNACFISLFMRPAIRRAGAPRDALLTREEFFFKTVSRMWVHSLHRFALVHEVM